MQPLLFDIIGGVFHSKEEQYSDEIVLKETEAGDEAIARVRSRVVEWLMRPHLVQILLSLSSAQKMVASQSVTLLSTGFYAWRTARITTTRLWVVVKVNVFGKGDG